MAVPGCVNWLGLGPGWELFAAPAADPLRSDYLYMICICFKHCIDILMYKNIWCSIIFINKSIAFTDIDSDIGLYIAHDVQHPK